MLSFHFAQTAVEQEKGRLLEHLGATRIVKGALHVEEQPRAVDRNMPDD